MTFLEGVALVGKTAPVTFAALFPVINPIGTAILLLAMTDGASDATRRRLARTIAWNAVLLLTVCLLGGSYVLALFGITVPIVQVAGGLVLAAMGWAMLQAPAAPPVSGSAVAADDGTADAYASKAFYPFTFPLTVGPGGVAVTLTLSAHTKGSGGAATVVAQAGAILGVLAVALVTYFCIAYAGRLTRRLGPTGTSVLLRLMAFVVVCIGAQICWTGVHALALSLR